jgi:endonuclease/exonuclease/phosphatase (EEP) superfamily protein YafD
MKKRKFLFFLILPLQIIFFLFVWWFQTVNFIGEIIISVFPLLIFASVIIDIGFVLALFKSHLFSKKILIGFSVLTLISLILLSLPVTNFYWEYNSHIKQIDNSSNDFKVMSFNIYFENQDMENVSDAVKQNQPDVVIMYELTSSQFDQLTPMLSTYYQYSLKPTSTGNGVFSKYKLENPVQKDYAEDIGYFHAGITKNDKTYSVYGIHPPAMLGRSYTTLRYKNIDDITHAVAADNNSNIIIAGDYNMVPWVSGYMYLMERLPSGFYNVGQGRGIYFTWSPFYKFDLPVSTIDQVVLSPNLDVTDFQNIWINGSDHHALIVTISK